MPETAPLTISELTRQVKDLVEGNFPAVAVVGEISNFVRASSGHLYLTLKDEHAQMRAVMWKGAASRLRFDPRDGLEVVAIGRLEVYAARGSYQLVAEQMLPQGMGELELAFRKLQEKLAQEGLFSAEFKQPIPRIPRRVALVTSPTGAAVRDMLQVMGRRWPALDVVLLPVAVQGDGAAEQIAASIEYAARIPGVDLIITGRGGGSLEDLWAFNEEIVARAIFASPIPVISAVGHEIDVSISDLVADRRALTPSEAAELAVPSRDELVQTLRGLRMQLVAALKNRAARARLQLEHWASRPVFERPMQGIDERRQRLDDWSRELESLVSRLVEQRRQSLTRESARVDALSPLSVLQRGYSITRRPNERASLTDSSRVEPGDLLKTVLHRGEFLSQVTEVRTEK
jgi:exodeoxyribonuclease VII large subunit